MEVQEKILRVVEYGSFERVGSPERVDVDVRIVAATHADLEDLVEKGRFKRDLLDRISFEVLYLPPLQERKEDISFLANHFAARMAHELGMLKKSTYDQIAAQFPPLSLHFKTEEIMRALQLDKKGKSRFILLQEIGKPIEQQLPDIIIEKVLNDARC